MEIIPVIKKKKGISPVWTLPVIALGICLWIIYTSFQNAGITIAVYFDDATGITPGKTQVIARGIPIGTVTHIIPDLGNRRIKTIVKMDKSVEEQLVEDTLFWVVRPEISAASVQGLDTLFSGSYIGVQAGSSRIETKIFIGLPSPPPISADTPGLHIKLRADELGSIQSGSGVYYRNVAIGSVTRTSLDNKDDTLIINLFIKPEYAHLVREGSRFCNASGLSISGKLTKLKVHIESLASLLKGGVVLLTPDELKKTSQVEDGHTFALYKDIDSARYGINMTLQLASSVGITEGETQVIYRGLVAGVVEKILFNDDERHTVTAHIMLDPRAERILRQGTQFWLVRPHISADKIENIGTLLSGPYITFDPGTGPYQDNFAILPEPPPQKPLRPGSELLLTSPESYSIHKGAPVTYKNKKVGQVLDIELDDQFKNFEILIFIYEQYEKLVKPSSVFWSNGGVTLDASLTGVVLKSQSISAAFTGGIAFTTPETEIASKPDSSSSVVFLLHENYQKAVDASTHLQPLGYRFQLTTEHPEKIKKGTPLFYKNIKVGKVTGLKLSQDKKTVVFDCLIKKEYQNTVNSSSRFFDVSGVSFEGNLHGINMDTTSLEAILTGGIGYFTHKPSAAQRTGATFPLYSSEKEALHVDSIPIHVRFKDCRNLHKGAPVKYKGVILGEVVDLYFDDALDEIEVVLRVMKKAEPFFRKSTNIWLENAEVSFSGIKNLKTVFFGSYINVLPGIGPLNRTFTALTAPPSTPAETFGGLNILLTSKHLGSLKVNSPLYYRQVKIGKVVHYSLSDNFQNVLIKVNIYEPFSSLIRENTKFWVASGTRIEGGLFSGVTVSTESVEAMLTGGIALATPDNAKMGNPVQSGYRFTLFEKAEKEWLDWKPDFTLLKTEHKEEIDLIHER